MRSAGPTLAVLLATTPAWAQSPPSVDALLGVWEVTAVGKGLSCRVQLRNDPSGDGYAAGAPPACRRALPALAALARWKPAADGTLVLAGSDGSALLGLGAPDGKGVRTGSAGGQDYAMAPVALRAKPEKKEKIGFRVGLQAAAPANVVAPPPVEPAGNAPDARSLPGTWAVMRLSGPSGCVVTLGTTATTSGRLAAGLAEGCQDKGMVIFSPVAWRYEAGRLTLTAAKGHEVTLVYTRDGFRKDPPSGAELRLTREP
jgi:hypothetical protein